MLDQIARRVMHRHPQWRAEVRNQGRLGIQCIGHFAVHHSAILREGLLAHLHLLRCCQTQQRLDLRARGGADDDGLYGLQDLYEACLISTSLVHQATGPLVTSSTKHQRPFQPREQGRLSSRVPLRESGREHLGWRRARLGVLFLQRVVPCAR